MSSAALKARVDSDCLAMFLSFICYKKHSKSDSKVISIPLCRYRYSCSVDFPVLKELE